MCDLRVTWQFTTAMFCLCIFVYTCVCTWNIHMYVHINIHSYIDTCTHSCIYTQMHAYILYSRLSVSSPVHIAIILVIIIGTVGTRVPYTIARSTGRHVWILVLLLVSAGVWHCVECMQYHYVCTIYSICTIVLCNMFVLLCKMLVLWAAVVAYRIQMSSLFHDIALCKSSPCWECIVELSNMALVLPSVPLFVCSLLGVHL